MTTTPDEPLSDDDIQSDSGDTDTTVGGGDADGIDGGSGDADGTDGDGTDGTDGDSTDSGDADGTDAGGSL